MKGPKILVAGILDTKGEEIRYLARCVERAGGSPLVLELSVGREVGWADIPTGELLAAVGERPEDVFSMDRGKACDRIIAGGIAFVGGLVEKGAVDGMIAYGGSMGASIASAIMRSLPVGVPKMLMTTMASGDVRPYIGTKDLCVFYPIAEAGLNRVTRKILNQGAAAVVAMAACPPVESDHDKPLIGCTMFGVTTPCVLRASGAFEREGEYDIIIHHATGTGGKSLEELIDDGYIKGLLDITTHEIIDEMLGGVLSAGPDRLTAAARKGIPQVVAPGGLDLINFGPEETVPEKHRKRVGEPGKGLYRHNPTVTCVGVSPDEAYDAALEMGRKLSASSAPVAVVVPMRGWGACDLPHPDKSLGWAGLSAGPMWVADPERQDWSLRSRRFVEGLRRSLDLRKNNIDLLVTDLHMNQPAFADLLVVLLREMLHGSWTKGRHGGNPFVVESL